MSDHYGKRRGDFYEGDRASKLGRYDGPPVTLDRAVREKLDELARLAVVRPDELDDRALAALADLPVHTAVETLDAFAKLDLSGVRSKSAYVMGMVNRTRRDGAPAAVHLPPEVQQRLDTLVGAGRISSAEFDHRCLDALSNVTAALALRALDLFAEKRSAQEVRNVPAFFASLLKQVEQEQRDGSRDRDRYRERERDPRDPRDWRERPGQQGPGAGYGGADGSLSGAGAGLNGGLGMPGALGRLGMAAGSLPMAVLPGGGSLPAAGLDALQQQQQLMLQQAMLAQQQQQQLQPGVLPGLTPAQAELLGQLAAALPPSVAVASQLQLPPITAAAAAPGSLLPPTAAPSSAAIPMGSLAAMLERKRDHGVEQRMLGVRTDELHGLSVFARYVHPAPALKLQQLWDTGVRLVSLLDDRTWEALSDLQAPDALVVIDETVEKMLSPSPLRNVNAYFMSLAKKYLLKAKSAGLMPNGAAALAGSYPVSMVPSSMGGYSAVPSSGALGGLLGGSLSGSLGGSGRHGGGGDYDPRPSPGGGGRGGGAGAGGGSGGNKSGAAIASLPRVLRDRVDDLLRGPAGQVLRPGHFDDRVCDSLSRLPEADALAVLREVGDSSDLSRMQNVAAYIMSIIKRHRHDRPGRH